MSNFYVVVDQLSDWSPYYPSQDVITFEDYLNLAQTPAHHRVRVINLCRHYRYLSSGYYCALLAESRGHHVFPSVRTLNDLESKNLFTIQLENIELLLSKVPLASAGDELKIRSWFGQSLHSPFDALTRLIFERFPCPLLEITLQAGRSNWQIKKIKPLALKSITDTAEQEAFANTFEKFSSKLWRQPKARKVFRYDLAILADPKEALPPSDARALKLFVKAANKLGIAADLITRKDYVRLPEYDGLFIRETTAVDHHTYRFAKKAEAEDMVVVDDPTSILRCTNKIYLADLFKNNKIPTPKTVVLSKVSDHILEATAATLGFPMVLKIPDGAFSRGMAKVNNMDELRRHSHEFLQKSALVLIQEFMYTEYDWRIGVFNGKALFACRYYMVKDHWQIYKHGGAEALSGGFDTLPTFEAPKKVVDTAVKAAKLIGDGLYGIDIKQAGDRVAVIEINDNPNVDSDVEDLYLGEQLYTSIMEEFLRRMSARHQS